MPDKKRFGISIEAKLAERLDKLCSRLGLNRSKVVEQAVARFLNNVEHYLESHYCISLFVVSCSEEATGLRELVEKHSEKVILDVHNHSEGYCRVVLVIESESEKILEIYKHVTNLKRCRASLISLHDEI
ncbi:MAG: ribbon-helix-helix protein, CopG family [Acidilobaceae archaeon]